jgi:DNA-binding CsgD family transcriptional regulator
MTKRDWHRRTTPEQAARRAGGRRHYNQIRALQALVRGLEVARLAALGYRQAEIARQLGVHRSTVCRDVAKLLDARSRLRPSLFLR